MPTLRVRAGGKVSYMCDAFFSPMALSTLHPKVFLSSSLLAHKLSHSKFLLCSRYHIRCKWSPQRRMSRAFQMRNSLSHWRRQSHWRRLSQQQSPRWSRKTLGPNAPNSRELVSRMQIRLLGGLIINSLHACLTLLGAFSIMFCSVGFVSIPGVTVYHHLSYPSISC